MHDCHHEGGDTSTIQTQILNIQELENICEVVNEWLYFDGHVELQDSDVGEVNTRVGLESSNIVKAHNRPAEFFMKLRSCAEE